MSVDVDRDDVFNDDVFNDDVFNDDVNDGPIRTAVELRKIAAELCGNARIVCETAQAEQEAAEALRQELRRNISRLRMTR